MERGYRRIPPDRADRLAWAVWLVLWAWPAWLLPGPAVAQDDWLRDSWREVIAGSPFDEPLQVESEARSYSVSGRVHARVHYPFERLAEELASPAAWCEILFLHLNVKGCLHGPGGSAEGIALALFVGRQDQANPADAERLDLRWRVVARQPRYLDVALEGDEGPYGTRAFRLQLRAVPDDDDHSLVQLRYSLVFGMRARLALRGYFTFGGRDRVGFTLEGTGADGQPTHVGGTRGMIERNVMRFYLALEAHLDTRMLPEAERLDASLQRWFTLTMRYPRQLFEIDRATYLDQKRREYEHQQALAGEEAQRIR
ncbi:hypothetical protein MKP05_17485 [Halomonas sp. EGI 63088]|uniref:Uncharacterized protein n=1 Tax=Halomonas flagellata TaxID=2920385 RepID=A0ABS9RYI6_9GAMM|nr:hypothetical protein [Halomonas flagellata]MCH4564893.1 hypothetical protein [Halomonas flagellata]